MEHQRRQPRRPEPERPPRGRVSRFLGAREGICNCLHPLTDEDAGVLTADDDDDGWGFCWRCGRAIAPEDL